jgi:hypothetical protein
MRRANFIVGFNNWGKSTMIREIFAQRNFSKNVSYRLADPEITTRFAVQTQSNDDIGQRFINKLTERLSRTKGNPDLFAALCPSIETTNDFREILSEPIFASFTEFNFFLLKYKWEHHAELIITNIIANSSRLINANFYTIDADFEHPINQRSTAKSQQIFRVLKTIY